MGLINAIISSINGTESSDWLYDLEFQSEASDRAYLKRMAIDSVLNFVGRTMSTAQFRFKDDKETVESDWDYILNVRPNKSNSAGEFWHKLFYKLIYDNEVLIILSDDNQLLIADNFVKEKYAIFDDTFSKVMVNGYEFKRPFSMSDVVYLEYNNEELNKITDGLFKDYGELFGRIIEIAMRNNQIRASVSVDTSGTFNEDDKNRTERLQKFIDKLYKTFKTASVALVPKMKGFDYEEYTNKTGVSNQSLEELTKMKKSLIDDVSRAIGVPSALVHGEMADLDSNMKSFKRLCIQPLVKKLQDELNAKLLTKAEYVNGRRIQIVGVQAPDIFELANAIDKIVSSGVFSPNDVLEELGRNRVDNPVLDKHYITKNYATYEQLKGGENENAET